MFEWINSHGIAMLIGYYVVISILGTMPNPGPQASYWALWAYAAASAFCGNIKNLMTVAPDKKE